jgi:AcrR family transcriptional regulator
VPSSTATSSSAASAGLRAARKTVEPLAAGVFFTDPGVLPRGRHELSREQVLDVQRDRLLITVTELLAAHGYRGFGPGEVASRAGVSLAAFYDCFENKEACVFAGYDRFIEVLLARMTAVDLDGKGRPELVHALVGTYLETLQSDLVVARAYQVEIDALGPQPASDGAALSTSSRPTSARSSSALLPRAERLPRTPWTTRPSPISWP